MRRILLSILVTANTWAQQPASFEVVSIKPASQGSVSTKTDNAIFQVGNISLFQLIERAYQLRGFQIVGPNWLATTRFEVMAKLPEGATAEKVPEMLQTMLSQRFGMVAHRETKEIAALALLAARNGPKLTPVPENWDSNARGPMMAMTMSRYAAIVSEGFDQPVVDATGITDEFLLDGRPYMMLGRFQMLRDGGLLRAGAAARDYSTPADELIHDLGLRLESRKMPMTVLTVDHIDRTPVAN